MLDPNTRSLSRGGGIKKHWVILGGKDPIKVSSAKVWVAPVVDLPCLSQQISKSYGIATTQRHITSKGAGMKDGARGEGGCSKQA